jgi:hypothetical protein
VQPPPSSARRARSGDPSAIYVPRAIKQRALPVSKSLRVLTACARARVQWIVQDGVLEVDGAPSEDAETMRLKYEGISDAAPQWYEELDDGTLTTRDLRGFRLLRRRRLREAEEAAGNVTWCTVEARAAAGTLRRACRMCGRPSPHMI